MPDLANVTRKWQVGKGDINDITRKRDVGFAYPQTMTMVQSAKDLQCAIPACGNQAVQWHHIKHRRKIKGVGHAKAHVLAAARQIPVCRKHHDAIHSGKYDGPSLKKLSGYEEDPE